MVNRIAVIIPCFNVEAHIEKVVQGIPPLVEKIFIVNDASKDRTAEIIKRLDRSRVRVLTHEKNEGVGGAVLTGYRAAIEEGFDICVKMDGDGQMKPEYLPVLVEPLKEGRAHYVKGNRFTDTRSLESMPLHRRIGNAWFSFFSKMATGYWNLFDVTNGYTAILTATLKKMDLNRIAKGYFYETSMLIELNIVGAKVTDVDMPAVYEGEKSHIRPARVLLGFPCLLIHGFWKRFYWRYIVRDFNILSICVLVGAPLFFLGLAYGISLWIHPPHLGEPTPAGTVMLAALPIILGFQLLLAAVILDIVFIPKKGPSDLP